MAQIDEGGDGRETSVELNLVPFIDLMSVCIIFLLITAVWTQVSMIQIGSSIYAPKPNTGTPTPPPKPKVEIKVQVTKAGYNVNVGPKSVTIPKKANDWDDESLTSYIKMTKEKMLASKQEQDSVIIALLDDLTYENLIRGMDAIMQGGFPEISIASSER